MKLSHVCILLMLGLFIASCSQAVYVYEGKNKPGTPANNTLVIKEKEAAPTKNPVSVRPLQVIVETDFPAQKLTEKEYDLTIDSAKKQDTISVGTHQVKIIKPAYQTVDHTFTVPSEPASAPYILKESLVPKDRKVKFDITNAATGVPITPDEVLIGGRLIEDGGFVKPGSHELVINKKDFVSIFEKGLTIYPEESIYKLSRKMVASEVRVKLLFNIRDKDSGAKITPDTVLLTEQQVTEGSMVAPGAYKLAIRKDKYQPYTTDITIPRVEVYTIDAVLEKIPPQSLIIRFDIQGDFPAGVPIVPDSITFNDNPIQDGDPVIPGKHVVVIKKRAYENHRNEIEIPEGLKEYAYKAVLVSLPRPVVLNLKYDVQPPSGYSAQVTLEGYGNTISIMGGEKVKPGIYEESITQIAYKGVRDRIRIFPDVTPYEIEALMEAKPVTIHADVTFDITPPNELPPHEIHFIDEKGVLRVVKPGGNIKPGEYRYEVVKHGYAMSGGRQRIYIQPSEEPFLIRASMDALHRSINIKALLPDRVTLVKPSEILVNGSQIRPDDKFRPGTYRIQVRFESFKDVERTVDIPPGVGRYEFDSGNLEPK